MRCPVHLVAVLLSVGGVPGVAAVAQLSAEPATRGLNAGMAEQQAQVEAVNVERQRQYELDRAAFRAEVAARHARIVDDQAAYARQQAAYADAMAAWRLQSEACRQGDTKACKAPTPVPSDFYVP